MREGWSPVVRRARCFLPLMLLVMVGCSGRSRGSDGKESTSGQGHVAVIDLRAGVPETTQSGGFFPLSPTATHVGLIRTLGRLKSDPSVSALLVHAGGPPLGFARAEEIGSALAQVRTAKKRVVCHTHEVDNSRAWLLQLGCDEIWLSPAGDASTVGIAAEITYLKGALDRVGIVADMLAMGRFKSGPEALTREGPSDASAENLTRTLRDLRQQWLEGATRTRADLRVALEDGPHTPPRAKELGLATELGYEEDAIASAKKAGGTAKTEVAFGPGREAGESQGLGEVLRVLAGANERDGGRARIAVVPLIGGITVSSGGPFSGSGITSDAAVKTLRRLRQDESVKAVVIRLDSPGGSPLASDLIWKQLMMMREVKPVIISIGSMAASGGYYIAAAGTKIVASRTAIVGSIGVFGGKIVIGGALEKFGVKSFAFPASPEPGAASRALHLSPMNSWDDATRERVRQSMQRIYDLFVERVATGRKMPTEKIYATAEGEIFLAGTGKERGLVDEIGGVERALELAREAGKLAADTPVVVEGGRESLLETLLLGEEADEAAVEIALRRYEERRAAAVIGLPFGEATRQLAPLSAMLSPLLAGESVVAALPYSLVLR